MTDVLPQRVASVTKELNLTPQEQFLYQTHLNNLWGSGGVDHSDVPGGARSSLYQSVQEHEGKYYNIPTVWNGKIEAESWTKPETGEVFDVPNKTALANVEATGWDKFPSYASGKEADTRYDEMHKYMEQDTDAYRNMAGNW